MKERVLAEFKVQYVGCETQPHLSIASVCSVKFHCVALKAFVIIKVKIVESSC